MIDFVIQDRFAAIVHNGRVVDQASFADSATCLSPERLLDALSQLWQTTARMRHRKLRLVLPSCWCYVHPLEITQRRPSRAMLAYALEDFLPIEIEGLTCDFLAMAPGRMLGIALENQRVQPLLAAFRESRLNVVQINLDVLRFRPRDATRFVWCDKEHVALLATHHTRITGLRVVRLRPGLDERAWTKQIATLVAESHESGTNDDHAPPRPAVISGLMPFDRIAALVAAVPGSVASDPLKTFESSILVDLGRDQLAPISRQTQFARAWRDTAAAMLVALFILIVGLSVHQRQTENEMKRMIDWERRVFASVFPDQKPPAAIGTRLASERRRIEALSAPIAKDAQPRALDALATLHDTITAIPAELRLDLQEQRIEGSDVTLRGRTRDHQAAESIGRSIDALPDWQCDPVRTERHRDAGIQFFIHGKYKPVPVGEDVRQ